MTDLQLGRVNRFDRLIDGWFEPLRDRPTPDRIFEIASHLGDWGLIWLIVATAQALRSDGDARRVPRLVGLFGLESLIVNQGIKRLFHRGRPTIRPAVSGRLREPVTTSFPSGHASSGAFAAVVLTEGDPAMRLVVIPLAVIVASSRIHTRMHHPSDVIAGACAGLALGFTARRLWPDPHCAR